MHESNLLHFTLNIYYSHIMKRIAALQTCRYIAGQLNGLAVPTARGGLWYAATVRNYHKRLQNTKVA